MRRMTLLLCRLLCWGLTEACTYCLTPVDELEPGMIPRPSARPATSLDRSSHSRGETMIRMLGENIAVRRLKEEDTYKGSNIVIPDTAKEKSLVGIVVAVGKGERMRDGSV